MSMSIGMPGVRTRGGYHRVMVVVKGGGKYMKSGKKLCTVSRQSCVYRIGVVCCID